MQLQGELGRHVDNKKPKGSWNWLRHRHLEREIESMLSAAQEQALNTNSVRKIYHTDVFNKCRSSGSHVENVLLIVSDCNMLARKDYRRKDDKVCLNIYGVLWKKYKVDSVIDNDIVKILWDVSLKVDRQVGHGR